MISLEQVRALESRVEKAVALIGSLRAENASMRSGLATAEQRVSELEGLVADFQKDQARIEEGIVEALRKLDSFEDSVHEAVATRTAVQPEPVVPAADDLADEAADDIGLELDVLEAEDDASGTEPAADALDLF